MRIGHIADGLIIGLIVFQSILAAVVAAEPDALGIPKIVVAWMAIANVGVGVLLNQLKRLGQSDRDGHE